MARSQETYNKKEVRNRKEKKRKEKAQKRMDRRDKEKSSLDDMIAYVDENGMITSTPPDLTKKQKIDAKTIDISTPKTDPSLENDTMHEGVVSFYNESKGFGFIRDKSNRQSVFVHANNLMEPIKENNIVSFEVVKGPKGPSAQNVKVVR